MAIACVLALAILCSCARVGMGVYAFVHECESVGDGFVGMDIGDQDATIESDPEDQTPAVRSRRPLHSLLTLLIKLILEIRGRCRVKS